MRFLPFDILSLVFLATSLPVRAIADNVLETTGFDNCIENATIAVQSLTLSFDQDNSLVTFEVAASSSIVQNVTASLEVYAYGKLVYSKDLDPCESDTFVAQLCPVPAGNFSAIGSYTIPSEYSSVIPAVAYAIPNLQGNAKLVLSSSGSDQQLACVETGVTNGKSTNIPAASYAAVGIAGASLAISAISAVAGLGSAGLAFGHAPGSGTTSPSFFEVVGWLQTMAVSGMYSVNYPSLYRSYTQNFGFSTGIISWDSMQNAIDQFRVITGGNLTDDSVSYLKSSTIVYQGDISSKRRRDLVSAITTKFMPRDIITSINGTSSTVLGGNSTSTATNTTQAQQIDVVNGIRGFVEELSVPRGNTFMTILLFFAVVIAAITAGILLFKVILEAWALFGTFPKKLQGFRQRYWWLLAKTITNLILLLYGVWVLYCIYQFKEGDSWAAKMLAGVTLGIFSVILLAFAFKIYQKAHQKTEFDSALYDDKETWQRYSFFYENFKKGTWWFFAPLIVYMFARGCIVAALDGHGLAQTSAQLGVDALLLVLLLWKRPYQRRSGNWINIIIQIVRVASIACILIFVEELGFSQTTQTVVGLVLLILQAVMTAVLAILIVTNAIISCVKANPHRQRRKENEKLKDKGDELTPLDAHNSMLMFPVEKESMMPKFDIVELHTRGRTNEKLMPPDVERGESQERLMPGGAAMGGHQHGVVKMYSQESLPRDLGYRQPQSSDTSYRGNMV